MLRPPVSSRGPAALVLPGGMTARFRALLVLAVIYTMRSFVVHHYLNLNMGLKRTFEPSSPSSWNGSRSAWLIGLVLKPVVATGARGTP